MFDGLQAQLAANRSEFYRDLAAGPFYGYNRPGAKASEAVIENWPSGSRRVTARFYIETHATRGQRCGRTTTGAYYVYNLTQGFLWTDAAAVSTALLVLSLVILVTSNVLAHRYQRRTL